MPTEFVPDPRKLGPGGPAGPPAGRGAALGLLLALLAACSTPPSAAPLTWEQHLAAGRLEQAQGLFERGDRDGARRTAEQALAESRQAGFASGIGRSLALLAALRGDVIGLQDAIAELVSVGDTPGASGARLLLADLAVRAGRADVALPAIEDALADLPSAPSARIQAAGTEARVRHLHAAALRLDGRADEAAAAERRAALALSMLPDKELLPLRAAVAQACGDDLYRRLDARGALARHAQAASYANQAGDRAAELQADAALAADFALDGQWNEAADRGVHALHLARELQDSATARAIATRGLDALRSLHEPESSARWRDFQSELAGG